MIVTGWFSIPEPNCLSCNACYKEGGFDGFDDVVIFVCAAHDDEQIELPFSPCEDYELSDTTKPNMTESR